MTKNLFNPQFGSIFRTCHNPTYFSRRLSRFSDIYMASLSCMLNYDLSYTFYPRRTPLQHEAPLWMDQLCTGCMKTPHLDDMSHIRWEPSSPRWLIWPSRSRKHLTKLMDTVHFTWFVFTKRRCCTSFHGTLLSESTGGRCTSASCWWPEDLARFCATRSDRVHLQPSLRKLLYWAADAQS